MRSQNSAARFALAVLAVYRCTVDGVTVFSDRPCEPGAAAYEPDTSRISTYSPPPATATQASAQPRADRKRRGAAIAEEQARHAALCERLRSGLKDVAARMRSGYNAKQGEQLRERKSKLEQQRRAQKCR
ncbi:MAG TPA: DUF4124 domain-containing protein [Steroidobacteraceae bacterium]|jgi:hypothetical protein